MKTIQRTLVLLATVVSSAVLVVLGTSGIAEAQPLDCRHHWNDACVQ